MIHCKSCRKEKEQSEFTANVRVFKTCNACRVKRRKPRITLEQCQQVAISRGGECLSTEYKTSPAPMLWRCQHGHEWKTTFNYIKNNNSWCLICSGKAQHSLKDCQELATIRKGKCLSTEYKNSKEKMRWRCHKYHEWSASFANVKKNKGSWCPECAGMKKLTIEQCREFAISKGGVCLSTEYKNSNSKMRWKCQQGHEWKTAFSCLKNANQWCPQCSRKTKLTIEQCREFAISKGGECLSTEYTNIATKISWRCQQGHEWKAPFNRVKNCKSWCPECVGVKKLTIDQCQELAISRGGECLSAEYTNITTKISWRCQQGHEWKAPFNRVKNYKSWCPECSAGRSETLCKELLETYTGGTFTKVRPKWLGKLELDGYCEELNMAFEYNGIQHYKHVPHFHRNGTSDFHAQQARDQKKYKICRERGIQLMIIPYQFSYQNPEDMEDFIVQQLELFEF